MFRVIFSFVILLHGFIHFMGFANALGYGDFKFMAPISKPMGWAWFVSALLFIIAGILFVARKDSWWMFAVPAILLSQVAIFTSWQDAKYGTIANLIILLVAVATWGAVRFEKQFMADVKASMERTAALPLDVLTEADIQPLPAPVQRYIRYSGALGKPKVKHVRIRMEGQMRQKGKDWFPFHTEQYNFFDEPTRLFFMKAKMFGITVPGYHRYVDKTATMDIRFFGLFPVAKAAGPEMNKAETVTVLNDMCLMIPATLIDKRITWEAINDKMCKAIFTNGNTTVSAELYFNDEGQLINFISNDRYAISEMKQYPFLTPVYEYQAVGDRNMIKTGDAVWRYPDGDFTYGKFHIKSIQHNINPY